jgi:hypothetical protein
MNSKLSLLTLCLAVGFSTVATPTQAGIFDRIFAKSGKVVPASSHAAPPAAAPATAPAPEPQTSSLPDARYPNGLGWRAIENDFMEVDADHVIINNKLDGLEADHVIINDKLDGLEADHVIINDKLDGLEADHAIINDKLDGLEADHEIINGKLDDLEADHVIINEKLDAIDMELGDVAGDVLSVADDVAALKNTLQVQVSVAPISADEINDVNNAPVSLFVQVTQNGHGVIGLTADSFVFANSFPDSVPVICGTPDCFMPGATGMYMIKVAGDWIAGPYAGTLVAEDGSTTATGTSLVTFEIPAEPAP